MKTAATYLTAARHHPLHLHRVLAAVEEQELVSAAERFPAGAGHAGPDLSGILILAISQEGIRHVERMTGGAGQAMAMTV